MRPSTYNTFRLWTLLLALLISACQTSGTTDKPAAYPPPPLSHPALTPLFDDLEQRSFNFFWDTANPQNGLVPDRYPNPPFASIAAVGFGLTAIPVGVERGYITRAQARDRVLATLRFFAQAPQGLSAAGMSGYKGFFYHFLDMQTGTRYADTELSTVDTSLLLGGMLFAQSYFDQADAGEAEIRSLVDLIYGRVDWQWAQARSPLVSMGWTPEHGFIAADWRGYDEAMIVYVLALGSPTHAVDPAAWTAWAATYADTYGSYQGQEHLGFAPLFGHQYSHVWIDFRGIQDAYMRDHALDYFENSRRATLAQRSYAIANVAQWKDYGENVWGLTACDGPGGLLAPDYSGRQRSFYGYTARGAGLHNTRDDGTIAPTAAASSLPFAPEVVIPAVEEMHRRFGATIYASYGFLDAFNTSFTATNMTLSGGQVVPGFGWVDTQYVGIDQGPIVAMVENYRSDLIWKTTRKNPAMRHGLERAGFSGGWLSAN